jgi:DNA repair protein RadC
MSTLMIKRGRRYCLADRDEILNAAAQLQVQSIAGTSVSTPATARDFLRSALAPRESECFAILWLDNRHRVLSFDVLFTGSINGAPVYPREVMKTCLARNAAAAILAHNHPSGVLEPSQADELITRRLKEALALVDVRVIDHVIVSTGGAFSFAERGLL